VATHIDIVSKDFPLRAAAFHFARRIFLIAAAATLATLSLAADPKPDATINTKAFEGNVFLDDKIKADPALSADCLAEGKAWAAKNRADADKEQDPIMFRDGGWSFERKYAVRSVVDGHYVSVIRSDYMDTHGAHPNSDVDTILWDTAAKKKESNDFWVCTTWALVVGEDRIPPAGLLQGPDGVH